MKLSGTITKVSGPLVVANGLADANVSDVVRVGEQRLIGEILNMTGDSASIQVYEETSGLGPGAKVETTGMPLSVELGPGMLENIYDGIQRPLPEIRDLTGSNITRGIEVPALNRERVWHFDPVVQPGTAVTGGDVIGTVQETTAILHKIMVPPQMKGTIKSITGGDFIHSSQGGWHGFQCVATDWCNPRFRVFGLAGCGASHAHFAASVSGSLAGRLARHRA